MIGITLYALGWLTFALLHSSLARLAVQKKLEPWLGSSYRLVYNGFSLLHLAAVFLLGKSYLETQSFAPLTSAPATTALLILKLVGLIIMALSLIKYDLGRFSGLTYIRKRMTLTSESSASVEPLQRSGLNKIARHPLYTGAFLYLWGGADSTFGLWTAIFGSLYLLVGTVLEERKLLACYGTAYRTYQAEVPRYFPSLRQRH